MTGTRKGPTAQRIRVEGRPLRKGSGAKGRPSKVLRPPNPGLAQRPPGRRKICSVGHRPSRLLIKTSEEATENLKQDAPSPFSERVKATDVMQHGGTNFKSPRVSYGTRRGVADELLSRIVP